jgi:tol-pal system protein YbgF
MSSVSSISKGIVASLIIAGGLISPAMGQTRDSEINQLQFRLDALEREVTDIRSEAYSGAAYGSTPASGDPTLSTILGRLDQLETEIRTLTGQVEEISFKLQQNSAEIAALSEDTDYRLRALEGGSQNDGVPPMLSPQSSTVETPPTVAATSNPLAAQPSSGDYQQDYDAARAHLANGDYQKAEVALRQFVANYGDTDLASNAQYWLGESYYVRQAYRDAAAAFLDAVRKYPNGKKAPDSMLKLGMSLSALGQTKEACTTFTELPRRYPDASQTIIQRSRNERTKAGCV